jgi:NADP-dependent 3-hydroxy acid dehydrogenase YdfG
MREVSPHGEFMRIQVDMLEEEQIEMMVHQTVTKWGRVDYAVNAAGSYLSTYC